MDSCSKVEEYKSEIIRLRKSGVSFALDKKGNFVSCELIKNSILLNEFFKNRIKFYPAILNGLSLNVKVELPIPRYFGENFENLNLKVYYEYPHLNNIYFSNELAEVDDDNSVVSMVWYYNKWYSPIYHSGNINKCIEQRDKLFSLSNVMIYPYTNSVFERVYFYTLQ